MQLGYDAGLLSVRFATGRAPTLAMQPASLVSRMVITAQRLHSSASITSKGGGNLAACGPITCTSKSIDPAWYRKRAASGSSRADLADAVEQRVHLSAISR